MFLEIKGLMTDSINLLHHITLKYYHDQIIKCDLPKSYFLDQFVEDMISRDLYITKDEYVSASRGGMIV